MRFRSRIVLTIGMLLSGSLASAAELHLTLDDAVRRALAANPGLQALGCSARASESEARAASRQRWGGLDGVATYDRFQDDQIVRPISRQLLEGGFAGLPFDREQWHYGVTVQVPLYLGGKLTNSIEIARLATEKARSLLEGTRWQVRFNVISLYAAAQSLDAVGDALDQQVAALEAMASRLDLMVTAGKRPNIDRLKVVEELEAARAARAAARAHRIKVGALLLAVLGEDPTERVTVTPLPDHLPRLAEDPRALGDDLENVTPVRSARLEVEQAQRAVGVATSELLPKLVARGSYMVNDAASLGDSESTWSLGLGMVVPLYHGGARVESRAAARQRHQAAEHALAAARLDRSAALEDALAELEAAGAAIMAAEARVAAGAEAARIEQIRYDTGAGTIEDLLRALAREQAGRSELAHACAQVLTAGARVNSIVEKEVVR